MCNLYSIECSFLTAQTRLIPLMGVCYMMQYMDKLALSQATLFNLRQDLVCCQSQLKPYLY